MPSWFFLCLSLLPLHWRGCCINGCAQPLLLSLSATCLQVAGLESKAKTALSNRLQRLPRPAVAPVSDSEALVPPSVLATATQRGLCYPVPYLFRTLASLARCGDWSTAVCATQIMEVMWHLPSTAIAAGVVCYKTLDIVVIFGLSSIGLKIRP